MSSDGDSDGAADINLLVQVIAYMYKSTTRSQKQSTMCIYLSNSLNSMFCLDKLVDTVIDRARLGLEVGPAA